MRLHQTLLLSLVTVPLLWLPATGQVAGPEYTISASNHQILLGQQVTAEITLDTSLGLPLDGWQFGVCHDPLIVNLIAVDPGLTTQFVNGGGLPGFYGPNTDHRNGFTVGVLVDVMATSQLPTGNNHQLNVATYEGIAAGTSSLELCDNLGTPPILTALITGSVYRLPTKVDGSIEVLPAFSRGDCNDDGAFNVADAIAALGFVFGTLGTAPNCADACDANDDGLLDVTDPVYALGHLFATEAQPAAPFPSCGVDPTSDTLACTTFTLCP
ncbi:MAG: hypothetical protein AAF581_15070 [Planctomycetota bacterium]